jgi:polar amino acid transport system permease protein
MRWDWLSSSLPDLEQGLLITLMVLMVSVLAGFLLAIPLALAQVRGGLMTQALSKGFCTYIRCTPLLMQLFLLYYGVGSLFPLIPGIRDFLPGLVRLDAIYYVLLAFTLSFAGYEGEVLRGALLAVPHGEIEAAKAIGMSQWQVLRRVWLPSAMLRIWPTFAGEVISQLKSTPVAFTVPVMDLMGAAHKVMQETYLIYEPLLVVAAVYLILTGLISAAFGWAERRIPQTRMA